MCMLQNGMNGGDSATVMCAKLKVILDVSKDSNLRFISLVPVIDILRL